MFQNAAYGERERLMITAFVGRSFGYRETVIGSPTLLNYRLGDIARMLPDACPCGRSLPLLSFPGGCNDEYLQLASGKIIHPQAARTILLSEEAIWRFQVIQLSTSLARPDRCGSGH